MKANFKLLAILVLVAALVTLALPASAAKGDWVCSVDPGTGSVGTTFGIACTGFSPNTWLNVYAVEPDGRASGVNIYGFFPTTIKSDETGSVSFNFVTEFPGAYSVPPGKYIFVVHQLAPGSSVAIEAEVPVFVTGRSENNSTAWLEAVVDGRDVLFVGGGFNAWEQANVWVTQPDGAKCSGLGIDQLTLGALGAGSSSLWIGPGTVKADGNGDIAFAMTFNSSACIGEYTVTVRGPGSGLAGEASFAINGDTVTEAGDAWIMVTPDSVPAYNSALAVIGTGFGAGNGVNCWFTRPDGRVLGFINVNVTADATGSFATSAVLDDYPPFTSTDPGTWTATCATPNRSHLATASFTVYALATDP